MNKSDLKNGMVFQIRYGTKYYIVLNEIYTLDNSVSYTGSFYNIMKYYKEDLKYDGTTNNDIMYVYDSDGNLIWKREEVDWSKIPKDTKVLVRDSKDGKWRKRYFSEYKDGRFYTFDMGGTSWSASNKISWEYCKLVEPEQKEYTFEEVECLFEKYCDKFNNCDGCKYSDNCRENWKNDNFTITRK